MKKFLSILLVLAVMLAVTACKDNCKHDDPTQIVVVEAVAPTCQKTGLTEGMKCNICGTMVVPQATVETVEHISNGWIIDIEPTETENGKRHYECKACGEKIYEEFNIEVGNKVGNKCPTYTLELVDGSGNINIESFKGKIVIITFWGVWVPYQMADLNRVAEEYDGEVVVLAVHSVAGSVTASDYIAKNFPGSKMLFAYDEALADTEHGKYYTMLGGTSVYPRTLILNEKGVIVFAYDFSYRYDELVKFLRETQNK